MDLKELKVERIALLLLVSFIVILFLDYSFNVTEIVRLKWKIEINDLHRLRHIVLISIVPLVYFISKSEYDVKPDILVNSVVPFLTFILGFYLETLKCLDAIGGVIIIIGIQLFSALTYIPTISLLLSKLIRIFNKINDCLRIKKQPLTENERKFVIETLEFAQSINQRVIDKMKFNS